MILSLCCTYIFFLVGIVAIVTEHTVLHRTVKCHGLLLQLFFFFKSPSWVLKDTANTVRLKYLFDHIVSGLTSGENLLYCLGRRKNANEFLWLLKTLWNTFYMRLHGHKWEQNLILGLFKSILYNASFMCTFRKQWQSEAFQVLVNASSGAV